MDADPQYHGSRLDGHDPDVLKARRGHLLPTGIHRHDQPPRGMPCEPCRVIFLADFTNGVGYLEGHA